jgi:hypothetical protein
MELNGVWNVIQASVGLFPKQDYVLQKKKPQRNGTNAHQKKEAGRSEFVYGA